MECRYKSELKVVPETVLDEQVPVQGPMTRVSETVLASRGSARVDDDLAIRMCRPGRHRGSPPIQQQFIRGAVVHQSEGERECE